MTKPLSPAAQAVDFAVHGPSPYATRRQIAVAALKAAAVYCTRESTLVLMTIAAELEAQP